MSDPKTLVQLEAWGRDALRNCGLEVSPQEVKLLLMAAAGIDKARLIGAAHDEGSAETKDKFAAFIERRKQREPVHRILGQREFHGLNLGLNDATLEPRDDTECLVELALAQVSNHHANLRLLDLGTGTGAVALALLQELHLNSNSITNKGALAFSQTIDESTCRLTFLDLQFNQITKKGGDTIKLFLPETIPGSLIVDY